MEFIDYLFVFCCSTMMEMGNLLHMSYEKINVLLFCYVEPILFLTSILGLLYVIIRLPGYGTIGRIFLWMGLFVIAIVAVLLVVSAINVFHHIGNLSSYYDLIHNSKESAAYISAAFNGTVKWLDKVAEVFHTTYETVNVWVYIILMPIGILFSIVKIIRVL